jgi:two-component system chemotaxis response regulator CheY
VVVTVILLVEDDPDILEITGFMLEDAGYNVLTAPGSEPALQLAASRSDIDIVLTDLNLRDGVSGIQLGQSLRENGLHCPLIVISGDAEPPASALQPWMSYLAKPFDRRSLLASISDRLSQVHNH